MKAIALLSGGLDSTLAIRVMLEQEIEIEALNFFTPFCQCSHKGGCGGYQARKVADRLGVKLRIFTLGLEYLQMLKSPKHGYGKNLNPCIDCRILMCQRAKEYLPQAGASFVITGEVLGQRPMSQHRAALKIIERESGLVGLILRPLSAKLLPLTIPEKQGWVNRERLLEINGRSRKPQMALAEMYAIGDYPCPAGGCLLTDPGFSRRMKDLMRHSEINLDDIKLLKVGRHFRLAAKAKFIVGRNEEENQKLLGLIKSEDICFVPQGIKGPIGLGRGNFTPALITQGAQILARYSDSFLADKVEVAIKDSQHRAKDCLIVNRMSEFQLDEFRV